GDVHRFDRLFRGNIPDMVRQPDVDAGGAIDAGDVGVPVATVDVGGQRAAWRVRDRVLECRGRCTGQELDQRVIVAVAGQRQVGNLFTYDVRVRVRLLGLQGRLRGFHRDGLGQLTDFHFEIGASDGVRADLEIVHRGRAEAPRDDFHV